MTKTFQAFHVRVESDNAYTPPKETTHADPQPTDSWHTEVGLQLINFYLATPKGFRKSLDISYPPASINVYNVIFAGPSQNKLTDYVSQLIEPMFEEFTASIIYIVSAFKVVESSKVPAIEIAVQFTDGSHIDVLVEYNTTNPKYKVVANSGRDSHNNNVLASKSSEPQTFGFNGVGNVTDASAWRRNMGYIGYTGLTGQRSGGEWVCTMRSGGSAPATYHCARGS